MSQLSPNAIRLRGNLDLTIADSGSVEIDQRLVNEICDYKDGNNREQNSTTTWQKWIFNWYPRAWIKKIDSPNSKHYRYRIARPCTHH